MGQGEDKLKEPGPPRLRGADHRTDTGEHQEDAGEADQSQKTQIPATEGRGQQGRGPEHTVHGWPLQDDGIGAGGKPSREKVFLAGGASDRGPGKEGLGGLRRQQRGPQTGVRAQGFCPNVKALQKLSSRDMGQ